MIRLVVALVVGLALHPRAPADPSRTPTIKIAVTHHGVLAVADAALPLPSLALRLDAPLFTSGSVATMRSHRATARIWLLSQRLLC
jgi:hypothetical protein